MVSPKVSIIMSTYQEDPEWLKSSITSILFQTYSNFEFIIILDDPQNMELITIVRTFAEQDSRIQFYINKTNKGLVYSLNRALEYSRGKYIARMDADDISHPNRLFVQIKYIEEENLDLIGSNVNLFNDKEGIFYTTDKLLTHKYLKKLLYFGAIGIIHPTFFAKQEVFKSLKYRNSPHTEDMDFLARAFCNGYRTGNIEQVLLDCRYHKDSITKANYIYIDKITPLITKAFRKCINEGYYSIDYNVLSNIKVTQKEKDNFTKKHLSMTKARENSSYKGFFLFVANIIKAFSYAPRSTLSTIKINLIMRTLKWLENLKMVPKK